MVRSWGPVVESAARLWSLLPPESLTAPKMLDLMVRLCGVGRGIGRSVAAG